MVLREGRIGSHEDLIHYDDGDFSTSMEVDDPIRVNAAPVNVNDVVRLADLPTVSNIVLSTGNITDHSIVRGDGGAKGVQDSGIILDDSDNLTKVGDLELDCGANNTLELVQVVWDDIRIIPGSFDRPGVSDPAFQTYAVGGGGVNSYLYEFAKNDIVSFTVQLPHKYKQGEDIYVHLHWTPGPWGVAENGNYVGWKIDYAWANINSNFGAMSTADLSDVCDGTNHKHQMTPDVAITGTSKNISSMLICNLKRTDTGADDTWSSAVAGEQPMLLEVDFHFPIDTIGSRQIGAK